MGVFKKLKSLTDSFAKATRRFAALTTFTGSSLLVSGTALAQTQTAPANNNHPKTEQTSTTTTTTKLTQAQKDKVNAELVKQAQDQAQELMISTQDAYSLWLQDLRNDLNGRLQNDNPNTKVRVVIMDPIQMDVGIGLGLAPEKVAMLMLKANGVDADEGLAADVADALTGVGYISVANDTTYTQIPMTIPLEPDAQGNEIRIVIPMSDYAQYFSIPGLSPMDNVHAVDRHEGWHAIDQYNDWSGINFDNLKVDSLQTIDQKINNPDFMKLSSTAYNSESYADIGSAGDMIRLGHSIDIIDDMIAVRMAYHRDAQHMSPPALQELKKEITAMGIDNFRALNNEDAKSFYNDVIEKVQLTPERLTLVYQYVQCSLDEREAFIIKNQANPDFDVAFKYINCFVTEDVVNVLDVPKSGGFDFSIFIDMMHAQSDIQSWDAKTELQKRAFEIDGKITPASYAKAYGSLMKDLDNLPEGASMYQQMVFEGKLIKLKNTFFDAVASTDYVQANKDRGVDIVATDPALQKIANEKDKAPTKKSAGHHKAPADKPKNFYYPG
jgi:hypothetical protein